MKDIRHHLVHMCLLEERSTFLDKVHQAGSGEVSRLTDAFLVWTENEEVRVLQ